MMYMKASIISILIFLLAIPPGYLKSEIQKAELVVEKKDRIEHGKLVYVVGQHSRHY